MDKTNNSNDFTMEDIRKVTEYYRDAKALHERLVDIDRNHFFNLYHKFYTGITMQDFIMDLGVQFTDEEKQACIKTVHKIIRIAKAVRIKGILGLEDEIVEEDNTFLKVGIELIACGRTPDFMERIFRNLLIADRKNGAELLERLLIAEGLIALEGNHIMECNLDLDIEHSQIAQVIAQLLGSMLGEKYMAQIVAEASSLNHAV